MINKDLREHFKSFNRTDIFENVTVFLITKTGQVLEKLGCPWEKDTASLGALFVGILEASEAVKETVSGKNNEEMDLAYSSSETGFFILRPSPENPEVFWVFLYQKVLNPGKTRLYAKRLRDHFDNIKIIEKNLKSSDKNLFENITDKEVDDLFSFVGI